jgi:hypothetical protein
MTLAESTQHTIIIAFLLLTGCSHHVPQATVEVIDTSASITTRAEKSALVAIQNQIAHMQRGDRLVLIPVTGDEANDAGGRILRFSAPIERETYDADLHRFQEQARMQFAAWVASLDKHQSRTDIFGALDAAQQEFAVPPKDSNRRLIILSDFLEDDGTYRFVSAGSLTNPVRARELAARLRQQHGFTVPGAPLCLGRLESSDFAPLSAQRKEAIQAFWSAYFGAGGQLTEIRFDGTGILADAERGCGGGK